MLKGLKTTAAFVTAVLLAGGALTGCTAGRTPAPVLATPDHVSLSATITGTVDRGLTVTYQATNTTDHPIVLTTGVPPKDTKNLPDVTEMTAYRVIRPDGVLEVAQRSFSHGLHVSGQPLLLLGTRVEPRKTYQAKFTLPKNFRSYQTGTSGQELTEPYPQSAVFCLGVVNPSKLNPDLQANTTPQSPVVHHGVTQNVICSTQQRLG